MTFGFGNLFKGGEIIKESVKEEAVLHNAIKAYQKLEDLKEITSVLLCEDKNFLNQEIEKAWEKVEEELLKENLEIPADLKNHFVEEMNDWWNAKNCNFKS